jgi:hypothetical protein
MRALRTARITPEELKRPLDDGEPTVIVDLRHALDLESESRRIAWGSPASARYGAG